MSKGKFITIEGGEGAGKSTQIAGLVAWLNGRGIEAVATREPGGSPGAELVRRLLVEGPVDRWDAATEALLHFAARRDHLLKTVWPALEAGKWVVSDRFADSTLAYQGYGHGLDLKVLGELYRLAVGEFRPDLTVILDLPVEIGLTRAAAAGDPVADQPRARQSAADDPLALPQTGAAAAERCRRRGAVARILP